jgi:hypothetical protein
MIKTGSLIGTSLSVGTCILLWNDGSPSRGILVRIGSRSFASSYSSEIGFRNILGPDTSISTEVLPEGQCNKKNVVGQHCYVPRRKKERNSKRQFRCLSVQCWNGRLTHEPGKKSKSGDS